jgi:hypothetical protein
MLEFNPGIDVFIASRDRPVETLRAIQAIKRIDFGVKTRIIVSDNASSQLTVLTDLPPGVIHIIRTPCDAAEHFNLILGEFNSAWVLMTHDDDTLLPALGDVFREALQNPDIDVVSGRSELVNEDGDVFIDANYSQRLSRAGLVAGTEPILLSNFEELLFDYGTLFPASAIIFKATSFPNGLQVNLDVGYADDFERSFLLAKDSVILFSGSTPVMRYNLHGGNSVFNSKLPFILPSEGLICRISFVLRNPEIISINRLHRLKSDFRRAILLAYEVGEFEKISMLMNYVRKFESEFDFMLQTRFSRLLISSQPFASLPRFFLHIRRRYFVHHENRGI